MGEKITAPHIVKMKRRGEKITCLTAYDYSFARILDEAGVEMLLVGDSLGCVVQGNHNTLAVTMDEMIYHTRMVARGRQRALVIGDMPFLSYQVSKEKALENAGRFLQEGGAEAVKLEGGVSMQETIEALVKIGIPVMGHIGLTPQSINQLGAYRVQGKTADAARRLLDDAYALEDAGVFSIVLELVPREIAQMITESVKVPTIGIGAGVHCDIQVLVLHDMLGINADFRPKFLRRFAEVGEAASRGVGAYVQAVKGGEYPAAEHTFE
jgi:3-methyl-2-oxobutanoate hydroxymethyltransferase